MSVENINYVWRKGKAVTIEEFRELLSKHKTFYAKLALKTKGGRITDIVNDSYAPKRWFWAWCFTTRTMKMYKRGLAYKHIYDSLKDVLYTDDSFPKRYNVSTGADDVVLAFGESTQTYEIAHPIPPELVLKPNF